MRPSGAGIGLTNVPFSYLGQARSLGSFGCSVFARGAEAERLFRALVVSEMAEQHQEEDRRRKDCGAPRVEGKRLNLMGNWPGWSGDCAKSTGNNIVDRLEVFGHT